MPKTIIITGADGGLGSAVTAQLLKNGHQLIASAVSQKVSINYKVCFRKHLAAN